MKKFIISLVALAVLSTNALFASNLTSSQQESVQKVASNIATQINKTNENYWEGFKAFFQSLQDRYQDDETKLEILDVMDQVFRDEVKFYKKSGKVGEDAVVMCTKIYAPVCGKDGITYGNSCMLGASHQELAYEGECK